MTLTIRCARLSDTFRKLDPFRFARNPGFASQVQAHADAIYRTAQELGMWELGAAVTGWPTIPTR